VGFLEWTTSGGASNVKTVNNLDRLHNAPPIIC